MSDTLSIIVALALVVGLVAFAFVTGRRRKGQRKDIAEAKALTVEVAQIADRRHRAMFGRPSTELGSVLPPR